MKQQLGIAAGVAAILTGATTILHLGASTPPPPPLTVVFDSPAPGTTMVDLLEFDAHLTGPSQSVAVVSRLELRIGGLPIDEVLVSYHGASLDGGPVSSQEYRVTTSARDLLFDSDTSAYWVARDAKGQEIARSARVPIAVRRLTPTNAPGIAWNYQVLPSAPAEGATVSGTATVAAFSASWSGALAPGQGPQTHNVYEYFVDGEMAGLGMNAAPQGGQVVWQLDTTRWPNGVHRVYVQAQLESSSPDILYYAFSRELDFENGAAPMGLVARFAEVDLHPGESLPLSFREVFTDGSSSAVDPATLTVTNTDTLNPPIVMAAPSALPDAGPPTYWGAVFALPGAHGATSLNFSSTTFSGGTTVRVRVAPDLHVAHLSKDGQTLRSYDPARSVFVRSYFGSGASAQSQQQPDQAAQYHAAGINTVSQGFYANPADTHVTSPGAETWAQWAAWPGPGGPPWTTAFDGYIDPTYTWAQQNGFLLLLTGDDLARTTSELADSTSNPWAPMAIAYALQKAVNTEGVVAIDMVDETDMILGGAPGAGAMSVLNSVNQVAGRPSVGWPILGAAYSGSVVAWQGDPTITDHLTYYWTYWDRRQAYQFGASTPEAIRYMLADSHGLYGRQPYVQKTIDQPFLMLTGCGTLNQYALWTGHNLALAKTDAAEVMAAAAVGAAGVRIFQLDNAGQKAERLADRAAMATDGGAQWPQTSGVFADPWSVGTDRWTSIGAANRLVETLTPYLFGERVNAIALPGNFVVGARKMPGGTLYLAVNASESPSTQAVDLSGYASGPVQSITRYRLKGDGLLVTESLTTASIVDHVTFEGAETIAWVVQ